MTTSFEDIVIVDLDLQKTTWSRVHSSMRTLYLKLSREPDTSWVRFFHEERESRIVLKRHGLWIEDGYIVFDCLLEDVETHHLPDFRLSVEYANQKCRELMEARRAEGEQNRADVRAEQEELLALRTRIRGNEQDLSPFVPIEDSNVTSARVSPDDPDDEIADFKVKRDEWRARFRAALASRNQESDRGND